MGMDRGGGNAGLGGYYDPSADVSSSTDFTLSSREDGEFNLRVTDKLSPSEVSAADGVVAMQGNPNVKEVMNADGSYSYTTKLPRGHKVRGGQVYTTGDGRVLSASQSGRRYTFTTPRRTSGATFLTRRLHSGNMFNFNNFNVGRTRSVTNQPLRYFNLFGNSWFR